MKLKRDVWVSGERGKSNVCFGLAMPVTYPRPTHIGAESAIVDALSGMKHCRWSDQAWRGWHIPPFAKPMLFLSKPLSVYRCGNGHHEGNIGIVRLGMARRNSGVHLGG